MSTEVVVIIALGCLAGLGAWAMLGTNVETAVRCAAAGIAGGTSGDCGAGAAGEGSSGAGDDGSASSGRGALTEDEGSAPPAARWPIAIVTNDRVLADDGGEVSPIAIVAHDGLALAALGVGSAGETGTENVVVVECTGSPVAPGGCRPPARPLGCDWLDIGCLARRGGEALTQIGTAVVDGAQTIVHTVAGLLEQMLGWVGGQVLSFAQDPIG